MTPRCARCRECFEEPGGLLFSPPDAPEYVWKGHMCASCWRDLTKWLRQPKWKPRKRDTAAGRKE